MSDYGFSTDPSMVRVDFFKPSGKWYTTEAVKWLDYGGSETSGQREGAPSIHAIFRSSLDAHLRGRMSGMIAVCLTPYHINAFPLMLPIEPPILSAVAS